jgi:hypothetical protein
MKISGTPITGLSGSKFLSDIALAIAVQPAIGGQFAVLGYPFTARFIPLVSTADLAAARPIARDKKRITAELRHARELVGADEERALLIDENDYIFSKFAGISH